jgi:membrane-associated phospholipid phosphatase
VRAALPLLLVVVCAAPAGARDLGAKQSAAWYGAHAGATLALGGVAVAAYKWPADPHSTPLDTTPERWGPDQAARHNFSNGAAGVSDATLLASGGAPLAFQWGLGPDLWLLNASVIGAEAVAANLAVNSLVKRWVPRPRPFMHASGPAPSALRAKAGADGYRSFYSGHASTAFTSATAGSLLVASATADRGLRRAAWGVHMALAGATASLRVSAGRHYYSDVLLGAATGVALGAAVPLAHGLRPTVDRWDYASGLGGLALGALLGHALVSAPAVPLNHPGAVGLALRGAL